MFGLSTLKVFVKSLPVLIVGLLGALAYRAQGKTTKARESMYKAQSKASTIKATLDVERRIADNRRKAQKQSEKEHAQQARRQARGDRPDHFGDSRLRDTPDRDQ